MLDKSNGLSSSSSFAPFFVVIFFALHRKRIEKLKTKSGKKQKWADWAREKKSEKETKGRKHAVWILVAIVVVIYDLSQFFHIVQRILCWCYTLYPYKFTAHIRAQGKYCVRLTLNSSIKSITNDGIENQHNDNKFDRTIDETQRKEN